MKSSGRNVRIIDGGIGTEIQAQGLPPDPSYWTAMAHLRQPEVVLDIYRRYIEAGADIISTNSFMAAKHVLAAGGVHDFEHVNRESVSIAREAIAQSGRSNVLIAGTLSLLPPLDQADDLPRGIEVDANYAAQADILAGEGADLLIAEMLIDSYQSVKLLKACCNTGLPVWAGASAGIDDRETLMAFRSPGKLEKLKSETFDELLASICAVPVQAVGVMHTDWQLMKPSLDTLARHWQGDKFAYAKTGTFSDQDWCFTDIVEPVHYASLVRDWCVNHELCAVGGCCGTSPAHIRQLSHPLSRGV